MFSWKGGGGEFLFMHVLMLVLTTEYVYLYQSCFLAEGGGGY